MLNSMRIFDPILDLEGPQSFMTMNQLSCYSGVPDGISTSAWKAVPRDIDMRNDQDALNMSTCVETDSLAQWPGNH